MGALVTDRNTPARPGDIFEGGVAAAKKCFAGALAVLNAAGHLQPATTALGLIALGRFEDRVDNSAGAAGDLTARVRRGTFRWANSAAGDAITIAEIGGACFIVDDQTVAKTDGGGTRSKAGIISDVDAQGVWVDTGVGILNSPATALLAANNLSDLGTKATARANLGVAEKLGAPTIVIGAENAGAGTINVTIQLKDAAGVDLAVRGSVLAYLSDDAAGDSIAAAAPSGGWAIGVDGLLIPQVAGKAAQLISEVDGDIDITITEAGAATWYLILVMPDGKLVASDAITFA
jgi:hypothetical protein